MKNDEIKAANRKARPKFVLWIVICAVIGGVIGFLSAKYGLSGLTGEIKSVGAYFGTYIAPWLLLVLAVVSPIVCAVLYRGAKQLIAAAAVVALHLWKKNTLLSIGAGTALYMLLIRL